jgi:hypothetical protein
MFIKPQLHLAIHQKLVELGWVWWPLELTHLIGK